MDNKSDAKLIIMQATIESNMQDSDEKTKNLIQDLTGMITSIIYQIKFSKSSPDKKDSPKAHDYTTMFPSNKKAPPLEGGHSTKIGGMWNFKHEISSTKLYELLIKKELKGSTDMDLKNFYNYVKTCLNAVTRL